MNPLPPLLEEAIETFSSLPGIGKKSAERLILSILNNPSSIDQKIASTIGSLKEKIKECETCFHYCEGEKCDICQNDQRDTSTLCVVPSPINLIALERCHEYKGYYHVLHGILSPINKTRPEDLRLTQLFERVKNGSFQEIILATPNTTEGDATAFYIIQNIEPFFKGTVSRLARGIPSGGDLDYLDIATISRALSDRRNF